MIRALSDILLAFLCVIAGYFCGYGDARTSHLFHHRSPYYLTQLGGGALILAALVFVIGLLF